MLKKSENGHGGYAQAMVSYVFFFECAFAPGLADGDGHVLLIGG